MDCRIFYKHEENSWKITHTAGRTTGQIVSQLNKKKINNATRGMEESSQLQMYECVKTNCTFLSMEKSRKKWMKIFPFYPIFPGSIPRLESYKNICLFFKRIKWIHTISQRNDKFLRLFTFYKEIWNNWNFLLYFLRHVLSAPVLFTPNAWCALCSILKSQSSQHNPHTYVRMGTERKGMKTNWWKHSYVKIN